MTPATINNKVATIERRESRPIPQTECPLVQPFARLVPSPTRIPLAIAMSRRSSGNTTSYVGWRNAYVPLPSGIPRRNIYLHVPWLSFENIPLIIPLMPITRPMPPARISAASQIIAPPIRAFTYTVFILVRIMAINM